MFVHLNTHSHYSFLEGTPSPAELVQAAVRANMSALALTDTNGLSGAVEFQDHCDLAGIQAILGMECWLAPFPTNQSRLDHEKVNYTQSQTLEQPVERLVLLAEDDQGWGNLCWLSSELHSEPSGSVLPLSLEELSSHNKGLICLVGGVRSLTAQNIRNNDEISARQWLVALDQIFPRSLYVNLQIHHPQDVRLSSALANLARRMNLPLVCSHEIHYLEDKEDELQRLLSAIRLNCRIQDVPQHEQAAPHASFQSSAEMARRFQGYPQALRNTNQITERCRYRLPLGVTHFPTPPLPPGENAISVLRQKALAGAIQRYGQVSAEAQARLDHELKIIEECGYAALFLIVEEIIRFARQKGIPFSSRGSAASSLVAYSLGITTPDPLKLNLYFERFLNPARATPPDIDTDLCSKRRDEVLNFVIRQFGEERVAMVATINRFRERSALREVAKAYGLSPARIQELVERLPYRWFGPPESTDAQPFDNLRQAFPQADIQHIIHMATTVLRKPRHLSIHAGGVVIAPGQMTDLVPTMLAPKGMRITQFDHFHIERLGLVKIDLLGIRGLSVLGDVELTLQQKEAEPEINHKGASELISRGQIPWPDFFDKHSSDPLVESMLSEGRTIGCFQIESPGMRATLREIQARRLEDIMVALSLYRPGPLTGGLKRTFVERYRVQQRGETSQYEHLHPCLAPLLGDTYGVVLYQEQVLRIAHELAGFSLAEADLLRRAMSHFDPGKQMQTLKEKFLTGAHQRKGIPSETAEHIWELMAAFAGYGFPKAHAASYAQIAWRAAWSKVHHPAIFMAAVLANWGGYYSQRVYLNEARRLGLAVRAPHINYAQREFSVHYSGQQAALFMGLDQVRDLSRNTQKRMIAARPFETLTDFLVKVDPRPQEVENLIRIGALEGLGDIPALLRQVSKQDWKKGQLPLFDLSSTKEMEEWPLEQIIADQEVILGVAVIAHPLELAAERIKASGAISTVEAIQCPGEYIRVAGMRQTWRRGKNARGEIYYFMALEDLEGMLDVFIPGEVYRRYRQAFSKPGPWIIEGLLEPDTTSGECTLRAARIELLEQSS